MGNDIQQVFTFFYAVLYGGMLNGLAGLEPFPWGFLGNKLCEEDVRPPERLRLVWRLFFALLILNVLPLLIFAWGYVSLTNHTTSPPFFHLVLAGLAALVVFAPYRFYHWAIIRLHNKGCKLYSSDDYNRVRKNRGIRDSAAGQFIAVVTYSVPFALMIWLL
jgi:hypothetical protein